MLILRPERLSSWNARKIKYAHQQDTNSWSDGKIVRCFYQQARPAKRVGFLLFMQRSSGYIHSCTVSELKGRRDFSMGIIRLEARHKISEIRRGPTGKLGKNFS